MLPQTLPRRTLGAGACTAMALRRPAPPFSTWFPVLDLPRDVQNRSEPKSDAAKHKSIKSDQCKTPCTGESSRKHRAYLCAES